MENLAGHSIKGYELQERIGTGGFGAVYRAYQSTIGREVAVKIILPGFASHPDFIRRFETEAQIIARLEHPYITPLFDYWRDPDGAYLVMRWLRGGSLRDALRKQPFDTDAAAMLLDQLTSALSVAHRNNVIHRDLKPGNILLDEDGNAYLADFGIAKDIGTPGNTEIDAIVGSPDYLSPEQARSEPVTPQTDIYSLGVVLYEILTGEHPFPGLSAVERLYKHLSDPLPTITSLSDDTRDNINGVIQKATAKNPAHRYADALSMAAAFREAIQSQQVQNVVETLTPREQEILQRVIAGQSNRQIAADLVVTVGTVKWYITQIYRKLNVRSRVQAIVRARELNLIVNGSTPSTGLALEGMTAVPTDEFKPENPYKGLRAFQAADYRDFFGREKLIDKLLNRMGEKGEMTRFLAVIGPSGSGKSSLVKAGLIPALWRGELPGSEKWFIAEMLPGGHPLDELEIALTRVAVNQAASLREQLERDERGLLRAAQLILPDDGSEMVVLIDQFEEVFTLVQDEDARIQFLQLLHTAVNEARSRVWVVITLRADFYDRPLQYPDFGELVRSRMETVLPLSADGLERAIARPAEQVGVTFEPGLVASIVAEVNYQAGALPLLQYALTELFERREGRKLTQADYQEIGGAGGALAKRAEEVYQEFADEGKEAIRQMFLRLVTLGEGVSDTRRRVGRSVLLGVAADSEVMDEVIDTFAAYRLLSLDNDPGTRSPTVEVAHEAILKEWERLRNWINDSREEIRMQQQLAHSAEEWLDAGQDVSYLASGLRLEQFEKWAQATSQALSPTERAYLESSLDERARQVQAEAERQRREVRLVRRSQSFLRGLVAVLLLATLGAFGLTGLAANQSQIAERNAAEAQNVALVAGSQVALATGNTDQAIALALQAVTLDPSSARAQTVLSAAAYAPGTIRTFVGPSGWVNSVALSPDGRTALSTAGDGSVNLWDVQTGEIIRRFEGHTDATSSVAFMPDGRTAISGSEDRTMIQWDLQTGDIIRRFEGHPDEVWSLAISPDGLYIASGGSERNIILWDIQTGEMIRHFEGHTAAIQSVEFSADGSQLLTASADTTVILWNVGTGQMLHRFEDHFGEVRSAVFSPDNRTILFGSGEGTMILWDIATDQVIRRFDEARGAAVLDVAFSPDGRAILSGGVGGIAVWNIETAQPISRLRGHAGIVSSIVFSPDGRTALSSAGDGTLRLWDLENGQIIRRFDSQGPYWTALAASLDGQRALVGWFSDPGSEVILWDVNSDQEIRRYDTDESITAIAFSPDGQTALFGADRGESPSDMILWDVNTGEEIRRFTGNPAGISSVAFSPDGRTAVSSGFGGAMILWDVATGQEIRRFEGYEGKPWEYVEFSPDGQTLAATYWDALIVLWDVATAAEIRHFEGHSARSMRFTFSGDGQRALSGSDDNTMILWDVASGAILRRFRNCCPIPQVDITSDGRFGIGGNNLWDLNTGEAIRSYNASPFTFSFAPDNHTVLMGQYNDRVELWRIDATLNELLAWTRTNRYIPELTCDQRELYRLEPLCGE